MYESQEQEYNGRDSLEDLIRRDSSRIKNAEDETINTILTGIREMYSSMEERLEEGLENAKSDAYKDKIEPLIDKVEERKESLQNFEEVIYADEKFGGTTQHNKFKELRDKAISSGEYADQLLEEAYNILNNFSNEPFDKSDEIESALNLVKSARTKLHENDYEFPEDDVEGFNEGFSETLRQKSERSSEVANYVRQAGDIFDDAVQEFKPEEIDEEMLEDLKLTLENESEYIDKLREVVE